MANSQAIEGLEIPNETLTIVFKHMMLFVRTRYGMDVLLPSHGHDARLRLIDPLSESSEEFSLKPGSRVWFTDDDGDDLRGVRPVVQRALADRGDVLPNVRRLLRLHNHPHSGRRVRSELLRLSSDAVPAELNARVELAGGSLQAAEYQPPPDHPAWARYADVMWDFGTAGVQTRMTNRTVYRLGVRSPIRLQMQLPGQREERVTKTFLPSGRSVVIIENDDREGAGYDGTLDQLEILYKLYDQPLFPGYLSLPREPGWTGPLTPYVPMCPPLEDCEDGNSEDCEEPPGGA